MIDRISSQKRELVELLILEVDIRYHLKNANLPGLNGGGGGATGGAGCG